jgi:hypothetical protein
MRRSAQNRGQQIPRIDFCLPEIDVRWRNPCKLPKGIVTPSSEYV